MTGDTIRPSDYGPSYVFELIKPIDWDSFLNIYMATFSHYERYAQTNPKEFLDLLTNDFRRGTIGIILNIKEFQGFRDRKFSLNFLDVFKNAPRQQVSQFYEQLANEQQLHYLCLTTFRQHHPNYRDSIEMKIFHDIIKKWMEFLGPLFVWGDSFSLLRKYDNEDSRFRVWDYNYYSRKLINAIGEDKIITAVNEQRGWAVEKIGDGLLLLGDPDPYQLTKAKKTKMQKTLDLEKQLAGVVTRKAPPSVII